MNKQSNIVNDQRGIILTDNVNLEWINSLSPRVSAKLSGGKRNRTTVFRYKGMRP